MEGNDEEEAERFLRCQPEESHEPKPKPDSRTPDLPGEKSGRGAQILVTF